MLVGDVVGRTVILIDDMADTCTTISRASKLLKKEGAQRVYALVTHGILSGDAIDRVKMCGIDKLVVTNSVDQKQHKELLREKLEVLEVGSVFAEVSLGALPSRTTLTPFRPFAVSTMERASAFFSSIIRLWGWGKPVIDPNTKSLKTAIAALLLTSFIRDMFA